MKVTSTKASRRAGKCMNPNCSERGKALAEFRGLCEACYQALLRELKRRGLTFDDAVAAGKCLEKGKPGRKRWPNWPASDDSSRRIDAAHKSRK